MSTKAPGRRFREYHGVFTGMVSLGKSAEAIGLLVFLGILLYPVFQGREFYFNPACLIGIPIAFMGLMIVVMGQSALILAETENNTRIISEQLERLIPMTKTMAESTAQVRVISQQIERLAPTPPVFPQGLPAQPGGTSSGI